MLWNTLLEDLEDDREPSPPPGANLGEISRLLRLGPAVAEPQQARLVALLYPELKALAIRLMRKERADHSLQATALVNEFYLQFAARPETAFENRAHFLVCASKAMRHLLVDHARAKGARKRGGGETRIPMEEAQISNLDPAFEAIEIDALLNQLAQEEPRMAKVVEMRYFGGLGMAEIAEALGVHERTVKRDWRVARAWMFGRLRGREADDTGRVGDH
jgi:RNA polymerase sigma factor (TIGR02999 family)